MILSAVTGAWAINPAQVPSLLIAPPTPIEQAAPILGIKYKLVLWYPLDPTVNASTFAVEVTRDPDANSAAGKAGLEKGDMILAMGNQPILLPPNPNATLDMPARTPNYPMKVWDHTTGQIVPLSVTSQ
jgi:hypothetical protein